MFITNKINKRRLANRMNRNYDRSTSCKNGDYLTSINVLRFSGGTSVAYNRIIFTRWTKINSNVRCNTCARNV